MPLALSQTYQSPVLSVRLMRTNLHYVLTMLALIAEAGHQGSLVQRFLHPEYANYSIEFEGFDPVTANYDRVVKTEGDRTEYIESG